MRSTPNRRDEKFPMALFAAGSTVDRSPLRRGCPWFFLRSDAFYNDFGNMDYFKQVLRSFLGLCIGVLLYWIAMIITFPISRLVYIRTLQNENMTHLPAGSEETFAIVFQSPLMIGWLFLFFAVTSFMAVFVANAFVKNQISLNWLLICICLCYQFSLITLEYIALLTLSLIGCGVISSYLAHRTNRKSSRRRSAEAAGNEI